jgi:hypothetical protein
MENLQDCAGELHDSRSPYEVGDGDAIDAPSLEFLNECLHAACLLSA